MFDSGVIYLDVVIGLAVAFFLLSLIPSGVNEAIAFVTRIRSKFLWAYLNQLFTTRVQGSDSSAATAGGNAARFATEAAPATGVQVGKANARPLPSSSLDFARLMFTGAAKDARPNLAAGADGAPFVDRLHRQLGPITVAAVAGVDRSQKQSKRTTTKHVPPRSLAQALVELLSGGVTDRNAIDGAVTAGIEQLRGTPIHATLATQWAAAKGDVETFGDRLEQLFDAEMARLSGLYKRLSRWVLGLVAVAVALVVNLDPVGLTRDLWRDPGRRADFVATAETATDAGGEAPSTTPELADLYAACRAGSEPAGEPTVDDAAAAVERVRNCVTDALDEQRTLGLLNESVWSDRYGDSWSGSWQWLLRPFKLAAVAAAIFFGAPFWWDVVRRLMGIRRTVIKPET